MNILQKIQDKYLVEFANNISLDEFLLNIFLTALLAGLLRLFYIRFGTTLANRRRFANNFLPLALGTLLIIMIVKSSIALSLGLVGALSIVRFRAAIKDPEELTFLFIAIGLGLAGGANQPILAILSFILIISFLYLNRMIFSKSSKQVAQRMFLNISTPTEDLTEITDLLKEIFPFVALKRMDTLEKGMDLSFSCKAESPNQLQLVKEKLKQLSPEIRFSIIDQPELLI